ncbi:MAG: thioesterase family protein [Bacteroidota bacterium]
MSSYKKNIRVRQEDLDELQHVNNIRYLEWVQEISKEHWEHVVENAILDKISWVVRNHTITYFSSAVYNDPIEISTQVLSWKGPISIRQVEMKNNKNGTILVKAITEWCAVHPNTLKPIRVSSDIQALFTHGNEKMA